MDWRGFVLGAVTASLAQIVALILDFKRNQWSERAARRRRVEERTEKAADELMELIEQLHLMFVGCWAWMSEPDQTKTRPLTREIERKAQLLYDPEARRRLKIIATTYDQSHAVQQFAGDPPARISYVVSDAARETLGALLRTEPMPSEASKLDEYASAIRQFYAEMEEEMQWQREQDREVAESDGSEPSA